MDREALQRRALLLLLVAPGLVPLLVRFLPFQDWPGHIGLAGGLAQVITAGSPTSEFYTFNGWTGPNRLFYVLVLVVSWLPGLDVHGAAHIVAALFIGGTGPAVYFLIRSCRGDGRLAVLATPLALSRLLYCGFVPNVAAFALLITALGLYFTEPPALSRRARLGLLALTAALVLGLHVFAFLVLVAFLLFLALVDAPARARRPRALDTALALVPALALFPLFGRVPPPPGQEHLSVLQAVLSSLHLPDVKAAMIEAWSWIFATYRYAEWDDLTQAIWLASVVVLMALVVPRLGWRQLRDGDPLPRLALLALASFAAYLVIPTYIGPPLNWWGANLRIPVLFSLLLVTMGALGTARWRLALAAPGALAGLAFVGMATADLGRFSRDEMAGFEETIDSLPAGRRVCVLHYTPRELHEYPGEPHGYLGSYYVARKGGWTNQNLFGNPGHPVGRDREPATPGWSAAGGFQWPNHSADCQDFVVRTNPSDPNAPFTRHRDKVELVSEHGHWRHWRKE